ncbi:MAG: TIGR02302 family protein, partial [Beijerinckiaceae bacterium]
MSIPAEKSPRTAEALLSTKIASAKRALLIERLWPALVAPAAIIALFLALSWFGLWLHLPTWGRAVGVLLLGLALLWSLKGLFSLRATTEDAARARLDRDSGVKHRPVEAVTDTLLQGSDSTSKALWALHQKRAAAAVEQLKVKAPEPAMRRLDPRALRFAPFAMALAALFVAGPELTGRVGVAFNWFTPPPPPPPPRLDVWIDPPSYTGRPPVFLAQSRGGAEPTQPREASLEVPVGATLVIRATPADKMSVTATSGLKALEIPVPATSTPAAGTATATIAFEQRFRLESAAEVTIKRGTETLARYSFVAIPDAPPSIRIVQVVPTEQRDGLRIVYAIRDDYGVKEAEGRFSKIGKEGEPVRRTLVPGPAAPLAGGGRGDGDADSETTVTLADHPWAGARVRLQLHATDDAGNKAESETREVTLPQRAFSHPLAKALVEQRRNLVMEPDDKGRVQIALDALLSEPERFYAKDSGTYLGLRLATTRLRAARTDEQLIGVAEWLWTMALELEDGGLSDAEKALRAAQERLQEALERNADAAEVRRLTEELRRAMERYMREFAERAQRDRNAENRQNNENTRMLNRNDMQKMLQDIERLSREGKHAEAMELLRQLNEAMKNLQAQRENGQQGERQRGMGEAMDELDQLSREQQELRDQTFREGQQRRR